MTVVCVASHKGGSGKTTVVANLAAVLARTGPVLAVDCDPQGGLAAATGTPDEKPTLYEALAGTATVAEAIRATGTQALDLLPADLDLAGLEVEAPRRDGWRMLLRNALASVRECYSVVVLDTPPGLSVLSYLALAASDVVIVTCIPEYLGYRALRGVLGTIDQARQSTSALRVLGILPTLVSLRTKHEVEVLAELESTYPGLLLPPIPRRVAVADAALAGQPVIEYAPNSAATDAFVILAKEVIDRAEAEAGQSVGARGGGGSARTAGIRG
jgi:chromosome partitioning protein